MARKWFIWEPSPCLADVVPFLSRPLSSKSSVGLVPPPFSLLPTPHLHPDSGPEQAAGVSSCRPGRDTSRGCLPTHSQPSPALLWPPLSQSLLQGSLGFTSDLGKDVQGPGSKERQRGKLGSSFPQGPCQEAPLGPVSTREQRQLHVPTPPPNTAFCCLEVKEKHQRQVPLAHSSQFLSSDFALHLTSRIRGPQVSAQLVPLPTIAGSCPEAPSVPPGKSYFLSTARPEQWTHTPCLPDKTQLIPVKINLKPYDSHFDVRPLRRSQGAPGILFLIFYHYMIIFFCWYLFLRTIIFSGSVISCPIDCEFSIWAWGVQGVTSDCSFSPRSSAYMLFTDFLLFLLLLKYIGALGEILFGRKFVL